MEISATQSSCSSRLMLDPNLAYKYVLYVFMSLFSLSSLSCLASISSCFSSVRRYTYVLPCSSSIVTKHSPKNSFKPSPIDSST